MSGKMAINNLPFCTDIKGEELADLSGGVAAAGDGIKNGIGRIRVDLSDLLTDPKYSGEFGDCTATGDKLKRTVSITCNLPKDSVFFI